MRTLEKKLLIKTLLYFILLIIIFPSGISLALSAEEIQLVVNEKYFEIAKRLIKGARSSIYVMMFEMGYYDKYPNTPSNLLIHELIEAKKRGVNVEVILEVREGRDRTTERNRHTGKILSRGGVKVFFDNPLKTTHAKWMTVDEEFSLVGSTNWTFYALTNNNEVSILIQSKALAKALINYFNKVKEENK
jgi:cardiolipin synthase